MRDGGYDITDFTAVDQSFGSLEDFDQLLAELHQRGIRLVLDVVPNHTSDEHPWFAESRASRDSAKRDWYVWADPAEDGGPPNNWLSRFGGSAWEFDSATGQYYYHAFLKEQPDLNWRHQPVRGAFAEVLRFWLRRGVDGFRVDASAVLIEDELLRDDPPNLGAAEDTPPPDRQRRVFTDSRPEVLDCIALLRAVIDEFDDRVMIGEVDTSTPAVARFYGEAGREGLHLPLNYRLLDESWDAVAIGAAIDSYLNVVPETAWPNWALGGHDKKRLAERIGEDAARVGAMLHLTLPGTVFIYAGDELGMPGVHVPPERIRDPFERLVPGFGLGRDPERTPMRWENEPLAGFTTGEPWLPVGPDVERLNVATQRADPRSTLTLCRELIRLRKQEPALRGGVLKPRRGGPNVVEYIRPGETGRDILVVLNLAAEARERRLEGEWDLLLSTHLDRPHEQLERALQLRGNEGVVLRRA